MWLFACFAGRQPLQDVDEEKRKVIFSKISGDDLRWSEL